MRTALSTTVALCLLTGLRLAGFQTPATPAPSEGPAIRGMYVNNDDGFSARLPRGVTGTARHRGFGIDLPGHSDDFLWAGADGDVLSWGSSAVAAAYVSDTFSKLYGVGVAQNVASTLSGLEARELVLQNPSDKGSVNYVRLRVAFRAVAGAPLGIIYMIGIQQRVRSASGDALFSSIVKSFRTIAFPSYDKDPSGKNRFMNGFFHLPEYSGFNFVNVSNQPVRTEW